jgi:hypothetical protein
MGKRQCGSERKKRICTAIIGKPVVTVFLNGDLPHRCAIAITGPRDGYLVNMKARKAVEYLKDGKFLWRRVYSKLHVWIRPKTEEEKKILPVAGIIEIKPNQNESGFESQEYVQEYVDSGKDKTLYEKYISAAQKLKEEVNEDKKTGRFDEIEREIHEFTQEYGDWSGLT